MLLDEGRLCKGQLSFFVFERLVFKAKNLTRTHLEKFHNIHHRKWKQKAFARSQGASRVLHVLYVSSLANLSPRFHLQKEFCHGNLLNTNTCNN